MARRAQRTPARPSGVQGDPWMVWTITSSEGNSCWDPRAQGKICVLCHEAGTLWKGAHHGNQEDTGWIPYGDSISHQRGRREDHRIPEAYVRCDRSVSSYGWEEWLDRTRRASRWRFQDHDERRVRP